LADVTSVDQTLVSPADSNQLYLSDSLRKNPVFLAIVRLRRPQ